MFSRRDRTKMYEIDQQNGPNKEITPKSEEIYPESGVQ